MNLTQYLPIIGLVGLGLYNISVSDWSGLATTVATVLGLLGIHLNQSAQANRIHLVEQTQRTQMMLIQEQKNSKVQ